MFDLLYSYLEPFTDLRGFGVVFALVLALTAGFTIREKMLALKDQKLFDGRFKGYTAAEAKALLDELKPEGRRTYILTQLTLDLMFPFAYGVMFLLLIAAYWNDQRYLLLIPLLTILLDLLENASTVYLAASYNGSENSFVRVASALTMSKWAGVGLSTVIFFAGVIRHVAGRSA